MSDVTRILSAIEQGDPSAAEQLMPLVYDELRKLAAQKLAQEKPGQTLQATALVHEAYVRLVGSGNVEDRQQHWDSRGHFFAAAAEAMRRVLVDDARRKHAVKHGGLMRRLDIDVDRLENPKQTDEILAVDEALAKLARDNPPVAKLVNLRVFRWPDPGRSGDGASDLRANGESLLGLRSGLVAPRNQHFPFILR